MAVHHVYSFLNIDLARKTATIVRVLAGGSVLTRQGKTVASLQALIL
jgi:hypothetical protein